MDLALLWKHTLAELEIGLGKSVIGLYFRNTVLSPADDGVSHHLTLTFPNPSAKQKIEQKYLPSLLACLQRRLKNPDLKLNLVIKPKTAASDLPPGTLFSPADSKPPETAPGPPVADYYYQRTNLLPKYTFATFVVGSSNNLAHAAAAGVVKNPGREYNPLFIYGGVGVGKTHLMQAVGNALFTKNPDLKVLYTSCENFVNDFIESIRNKTAEQFRKKYRTVDLLLIDDIQFISGKESSQDEIFHTFNSLHQREKQIVLTSDRRPEEIEKVASRIISRFMGGLTVDIQPPDLEMRIAIIQEKLSLRGEKWNKEAIDYLAERVETNIRQLEGTITNLVTKAVVESTVVDIPFIQKVLGEAEVKKKAALAVSPKAVLLAVAKQYGLKTSEILSDKRDATFVLPRQVTMYLLREIARVKLVEVARALNRKDHTTVLHAVGKIAARLKSDDSLRQQVIHLKKELWG